MSSIYGIGSTGSYGTLATAYLQNSRSSAATGTYADETAQTDAASELYATLDSDGDGSVSEQEFSDALSSVLAQLNGQLGSGPAQGPGGAGGMPPPPPPQAGEDSGFTLDELTAQLEETGDTDSARAGLLSSVIENFDTADSDGDGKVTFEEAIALQESLSGSTSGTGAATAATGSGTVEQEQVLAQILRLAQTYDASSWQSGLPLLSVSA
ncbi:EF-hand domain-containing protein [Pseudothauera rhizosphaerae]|nr:EF-hand domain-containing protein [Pseudothauera rhizosphaerae]